MIERLQRCVGSRAFRAAALSVAACSTTSVFGVALDDARDRGSAFCAGLHASDSAADIHTDVSAEASTLLHANPQAALRVACRRLALLLESQKIADHVLDVAEAAVETSRLNDAADLLAAMASAADLAEMSDPESIARLQFLKGRIASERAEAVRADEYFTAARSVLEAAGLGRTRRFAAVLVSQAGAWRQLRQPGGLERATDALIQAETLLRALGLEVSFDMTDVLNQRAVLAYARQDLLATVDLAKQEVAMYRQLGHGNAPGLIHTQATLGAVLSQLGRFDESDAELREGLRLIDINPGAEQAGALGVLNNLAALDIDRGRPQGALNTADRAVVLADEAFGSGSPRSVRPRTLRGVALSSLARYAEAKDAFEGALAIAATNAENIGPLRRMFLQDSLAAALLALGEMNEARELLERSAAEMENVEGVGYWRGRLLRRRAAMAAYETNWPETDESAARAMALMGPVVGERNPYVIDLASLRCVAQSNGTLPGSACADLESAISGLDNAAPHNRFNALAALARADDRSGRHEQALTRHLQALVAARSAATPDPLWSAYSALAEHLRRRGLRSTAVLMGKLAIEQIELMRSALGADAQRFERGFLADKLIVYRRLADWLTQDNRVDEALQVIRLLKEEEFFDFTNRDGSVKGKTAAGISLSDNEEQLSLRLGLHRDAAARGPGQEIPTPQREAAEAKNLLDRLEQQRQSALQLAAATNVLPSRSMPPAGELRVWLYPGEHHVNLVIDGRAKRTVSHIPVAPAELAASVAALLGAMERREPVLRRLQSLYALLAAPIDRAAETDHARQIVLTIDGPLRYLPFAALHDGRNYLGARYSVEQRVPVPTTLKTHTGSWTGPQTAGFGAMRVQAMGVTRRQLDLAALDAVAGEVCNIVAGPVLGLAADEAPCGAQRMGHGVLPGSGWMNDEFTVERLNAATTTAPQPPLARNHQTDILHIGTHFVLRPGRINRSWLALGGGQRLTLENLGRMDFSHQGLVTLSACETGLGGAVGNSGEEIDGLGGVILRRGAGAVVASLWRVEDRSTGQIMQAFYRQIAVGVKPPEALQRAQQHVRSAGERFSHPFYWAGFYLTTGMR